MIIWGIILDFLLFGSGVPVFAAFGFGSALVLIFYYQVPISDMSRTMFSAVDQFSLLAAPLFILLGGLAVSGGIGRRLVDLSSDLFGHLPAGLLVASIVFCTIFAAISGSGLAAIAAIGTVMFPELRKCGYSEGTSSAAIASAGQLGILIPPSIFFIVVAMLMQSSAVEMFAAGLFPGLLMSLFLCVTAVIMVRKEHVSRLPPVSRQKRLRSFLISIPALLMIVLILGGIYSGLFTPTEAATISCVYAMLVGFVIYRKLRWSNLLSSLGETALVSGTIYILIGGVFIFNQLLIRSGFSASIGQTIANANLSPIVFIGLLNIFVLIITFFIDPWALMFMIIPVLMPTFTSLNLNLNWLAVMLCICTMVGYLTPPMAPGLYFASRVLKVPSMTMARSLIPYLIAMTLVIPVVMFWPDLATWLPAHLR